MSQAIEILIPVGRVVQGDLYKPQDKDANGAPMTVKTGPNIGKPQIRFFFAVAVPKIPGHTHWSQTEWGAKIWAHGHASWPQGQAQAPGFAWKVEDGDSTVPNKRGRVNARTEGMPGNWIVNLSSGYPPKIFNADGSQPMLEANAVKRGYFIEVAGTCVSNENAQNPGMYMNHSLVAFRGFGQEIISGPDPRAVGFGKSAAPAGMSAAPIGSVMGAPPPPASPGAPPPPVVTGAPPPPPAPTAAYAPPPATAVAPHPGYLNPGAVAAAAPPPVAAAAPPPPVAAGPVWKGPAAGYDAHIKAGWTDAALRQAGYIV